MALETIQLEESLIKDIEDLDRATIERLNPDEEYGNVNERLIRDIEGWEPEAKHSELPEAPAPSEANESSNELSLEEWYVENREVIREKDPQAAELAEEEIAYHSQENAKIEQLATEYPAKSPEVAKVEEEMENEEVRFEQRLKGIIAETYTEPKRGVEPQSIAEPERVETPVAQEELAPTKEQPAKKEMLDREQVGINSFKGKTSFSPSEDAASMLEEYQRLRKLKSFEGPQQTFTQPDGRSMVIEYDGNPEDPERYLKEVLPIIERQLTIAEYFSEAQHETAEGEDAIKSFESSLIEEYGQAGVNVDRRLPDGQRIERWEPGIVTNIADKDGVISISFEYDEEIAAHMQQYLDDEKRKERQ